MLPLGTNSRLSPKKLVKEAEALGLSYREDVQESLEAWLWGGGFPADEPTRAEHLVFGAWRGREVQAFDLWCGYGRGARAYSCCGTATDSPSPRTSIWGRGGTSKLLARLAKGETPGGREFDRLFEVHGADPAFVQELLTGPAPEWLVRNKPRWPMGEAGGLSGKARWGYEIDRGFALYFRGHVPGGAWASLEDLFVQLIGFVDVLADSETRSW